MNWFYYAGRVFTWTALLLLTRWHITGKEHVPPSGPLLIVANHLSMVDPPMLGVSVPRKIMFMAKEELFRSAFNSYFLRGYGAFPVSRGRIDRRALSQAWEWLRQGQALVMFPEGSRSLSGCLQQALPGSALIATRARVPILPVGLTGTEAIGQKGWWLRRPELTVNIGEPFVLPGNGDSRSELAELTNFMMVRIARLLPEKYRGIYG